MYKLSRRDFLLISTGALAISLDRPTGKVMTVTGLIDNRRLGNTLVHEHVLVDFIGAAFINENRWDKLAVANTLLPYLAEAKQQGLQTLVECTPAFLGRDVRLLKILCDKTGLQIITNTGYYGALNNKFLPAWAFTETAEQLATRWTDDFDYGIDGTIIRPGIIKIGVDATDTGLSALHQKLVRAAALTHLKTGLTIYSHTGPGQAALEQIEILKKEGVSPDAFVWVHAQAEHDKSLQTRVARMGSWVSFDGITGNYETYADSIASLKEQGLLHRVLISQDAGYYRPGEPGGGKISGYTAIFTELFPLLFHRGFSKKDIRRLLQRNPAGALQLQVRKGRY